MMVPTDTIMAYMRLLIKGWVQFISFRAVGPCSAGRPGNPHQNFHYVYGRLSHPYPAVDFSFDTSEVLLQ